MTKIRLSEAEYRAHEGISKSALFHIKESPEKFRYAMDNPEPPTPALLFGRMVHKLLLEPETFEDEFAIAPCVDRRTKVGKEEWEAFMQLTPVNAQIVAADDYAKAVEMVKAVEAAPFTDRLLAGDHELPLFWTDELTGEACKARLDCLSDVGGKTVIVDYKTTADASTDAFMHAAVKHGYDLQAAMYSEAVKANGGEDPIFVFIAQEKTAPYAVNILQADEVFVRRGYDLFRELIGTYHDCKVKDNWWGYLGPENVINNLALPAWLAKEVE